MPGKIGKVLHDLINRIIAYIIQLWHSHFHDEVTVELETPQTETPEAETPEAENPLSIPPKEFDDALDQTHPDEYGAFYFKKEILDRLDQNSFFLKRIRLHDPQAYGLFSRIGVHLLPDNQLYELDLNSWWTSGERPSFGAVQLCAEDGSEDVNDTIGIKLAYFIKKDRPPHYVEMKSGGTVYEVVCFYDTKKKPVLKHGVPVVFHVHLSDQGDFRLLRWRVDRDAYAPSKKHGHLNVRIPQKNIRTVPHELKVLLQDQKERNVKDKPSTADELAQTLFSFLANTFISANTMIRVSAEKGDIVTTFGIHPRRAAYFFKDRDLKGENQRKKIFHTVRPHERTYKKSGKKRPVRLHFRGLRKFTWNGYDITITVPGKDHTGLEYFHGASHEIEKGERFPKGMVRMEKMAKMIDEDIRGER
jgi:hypothetical protein